MATTAIAPSLEGAVTEATILIRLIDKLERKASPAWWELADLTDQRTYEKGANQHSEDGERLTILKWAEQIGWTEANGKSIDTLKSALKIARAWPENLRVDTASFWQHREALDHFDGNAEDASAWLADTTRPRSVRDVTRSGVMGTGPIFDCIRLLIRARRMVLRIPAKLADADALGTEPNFDQLRREVNRLKRGMAYVDRYLADETTLDMDEFQAGLDKILKEASS